MIYISFVTHFVVPVVMRNSGRFSRTKTHSTQAIHSTQATHYYQSRTLMEVYTNCPRPTSYACSLLHGPGCPGGGGGGKGDYGCLQPRQERRETNNHTTERNSSWVSLGLVGWLVGLFFRCVCRFVLFVCLFDWGESLYH